MNSPLVGLLPHSKPYMQTVPMDLLEADKQKMPSPLAKKHNILNILLNNLKYVLKLKLNDINIFWL